MKHNVAHRLIAIALAALMTASLASCSDNGGTASTGGSESRAATLLPRRMTAEHPQARPRSCTGFPM